MLLLLDVFHFLFLTSFQLSQALPLLLVTPSPMSMRPASFWSGPSPWKQVAERMCGTTSCADGSCQMEGAWKNVAPMYVFCHAVLACQTPRWWWPTCSHTPTTVSCWRLSTGFQSWPKTMQSSMCHLMWQPIRQVCCTRSVINCQYLIFFQSQPPPPLQVFNPGLNFPTDIITILSWLFSLHYRVCHRPTYVSDSWHKYLGLITKTPDDQIITVFVQQICRCINFPSCTIPAVNEGTWHSGKLFAFCFLHPNLSLKKQLGPLN